MKVKLNGNDFYEVTCPFGSVDPLHPTGHRGIDLSMISGTELYSPVDGIVSKIVDYGNNNLGKGVFIKTEDDQTIIMGHLSDFKVFEGQRVSEGDLVALSGNTGHSTGAHLHFALKDESGNFVNPDKYLNDSNQTVFDKFVENGKVDNYKTDIVEDKTFIQFLNDWREDGFWVAMYDKPFFEVVKDFFAQLFHDILKFLLSNADLFFIAPAIVLMLVTFMIGKNKYTKFIVPLWFAYFISSVLNYLIP